METKKRKRKFLYIGEAAEFLGTCKQTLRNWDLTNKLKPKRHPKNKYRMYALKDLERVLEEISV